MNIYNVLESLQREVTDSQPLPWPLQEKSVVNRHKLLKILERSRDELPEEVKQARWISRETERIASESSHRADRVVRDAQARSREIMRAAQDEVNRLVEETEVVTRARQEATRLLDEAREEARRLRSDADLYARETRGDADRYALKVLNGMETELGRILSTVKRGQAQLLQGSSE